APKTTDSEDAQAQRRPALRRPAQRRPAQRRPGSETPGSETTVSEARHAAPGVPDARSVDRGDDQAHAVGALRGDRPPRVHDQAVTVGDPVRRLPSAPMTPPLPR